MVEIVGIISFSIGMLVGFCVCALLSVNKINGEIYYIDLSDKNNDITNDNDNNNDDKGVSNEEI